TPSEMTGAPPWYIGTVPWNGKAVPLVSFEGACGQMIPPASGRTRIVILHALGTRVEGGNFALISQGFPQLVRVSSDVVRPASPPSGPMSTVTAVTRRGTSASVAVAPGDRSRRMLPSLLPRRKSLSGTGAAIAGSRLRPLCSQAAIAMARQ